MPLLDHIQFLAFAFLCALLLAFLCTPVAMWLGFRLGLVDQPGGRRIHEKPTPRSGGLAVFAAFFAALFLISHLKILPALDASFRPWVLCTFWVSLPVLILGIIDDRWEVRPGVKFAGQCFIAVLAWTQGLQLERILGMELPILVDFALSVFIFLCAMNAYNLIDGMDGVAGGLGAVTGIGLCGLNLMQGNTEMAAASLALSGACGGFLRYNFHPARVFLGDTGSMFIGFILIALTFGTEARSAAAVMLIVPLLTLGVPLLDTGLAVWRRTVRKALNPGTCSVSQGDRDHLHHRLARSGLTQRRVAATLYGIQAALFAVGLLWVFFQSHRLAIFTAAFFVGSYVLIRYLASLELTDSGKLIVDGIRRPDSNKLYSSLMPFMDIAFLGLALAAISWLAYPDFPCLQMTVLFRESAPTIIGGPMILLWASRYYRPQWTRARALDFFYIGIIATIGVLVGVALSQIPTDISSKATVRIAILYAALSVPPMVLIRAFPRLVQDMVHFHERNRKNHGDETKGARVLVYGAGYGYTLLTRAESFEDSRRRRQYQLIGLIDDDRHLKGRVVHGHPVLGTGNDLPALIRAHKIQEILLTTPLHDENQQRLLEIAESFNIRISQSLFVHSVIRE
jgi:UDP-N-acetylmuramyl pentapeptide phosphotransferase/UDP-N-acetylglucosamine-1-phosphate transferase